MDPYPEQQREMSIPIRTKEDTPSFVAGNTLRDLSPMRDMTPPECHDMTCPKCHAEDPEAFQAALTIMNLNAADRNLGLKDDDQQGMSLNNVLRPVDHSVATEDTEDDEWASKDSALVP